MGTFPIFESAKFSILSLLCQVKPAFEGICGSGMLPRCPQQYDEADSIASDLHEYLGGASLMPTSPHPITNEKVPLILGHEFSGIVEETGEGVHDIKVGSRVVVQPIIYDGTCNACKEGYINCCDNNGFLRLGGKSFRTMHNSYMLKKKHS